MLPHSPVRQHFGSCCDNCCDDCCEDRWINLPLNTAFKTIVWMNQVSEEGSYAHVN